ncbi:acyl-CoA dehydrogenase [Alteromonas lipolytica]|uniref:3-methylmercaptopropionyl-CoA dehydrogenase n=1 Tax=Alteromonas lipolytica TaxID=1856405 RepID=A0A1E8FDB2_9ALTE|nr:acyl-CoA dehydrogenase [Alteromonas lipolytica]OFI33473.1 acyl-CoA dehydrogenase [Alteromonas lipolytica]GGF59389.1 acyl-CoA dehydrogenase [Alteromonas lipolytica]
MQTYTPPLEELRFLLNELVDLSSAVDDPDTFNSELAMAIWEEAGKFASGVLLPTNQTGDTQGLSYKDGIVTVPEVFHDVWQQMRANGWNNMGLPEEFGGQGLPRLISTVAEEMFSSGNKAFVMCPSLTQGAAETLLIAASDELKQRYLPKMVSGEWTGTMNLTEPSAGSDVGALKTRAVQQEDGSYRIKGQKIFISFGEHDLAENIIHLVLARTPDAPAGVKGISLFLVPKILVNDDGSLGERNDVICTAIEHKVGIHVSPTAVMSYGDNDGAVGYLVGEENKGLAAMFIMMNMARLNVGVEGLGSAELAVQQARAYAAERIQGATKESPQGVPIVQHADVKRMLMSMSTRTRAMRAMAMVIAEAQDIINSSDDVEVVQQKQGFIDLLTPVFKAWATESAVDIASLGMQIHGGMGYVEETGVAQIWRDVRISSIYEGTTGIQANDLVGRKLLRDKGESVSRLVSDMRETVQQLTAAGMTGLAGRLEEGVNAFAACSQQLLAASTKDFYAAQMVSVPYLMMVGNVTGAWLLARCAIAANQHQGSGQYSEAELAEWLAAADFYHRYTLAEVAGFQRIIANFVEEA